MNNSEDVPEELVEEFQVEELEERIEFAEWSGSASAEASCSTGEGCEGKGTATVSVTV